MTPEALKAAILESSFTLDRSSSNTASLAPPMPSARKYEPSDGCRKRTGLALNRTQGISALTPQKSQEHADRRPDRSRSIQVRGGLNDRGARQRERALRGGVPARAERHPTQPRAGPEKTVETRQATYPATSRATRREEGSSFWFDSDVPRPGAGAGTQARRSPAHPA